jgi:ribosomal-protein-alanine N-acetyltransferase
VNVRPAKPADAPALAQVHASAFDASWSAEEIRRFAEDRGGLALVAEMEDGAVAGFILCRAIAGEAEILTLAVRPALRRRGIAAALLGAAMVQAAAIADAMLLEVAADNPAAIALYEQAGFTQVGRRAGYYGRPAGAAMDAIVMRRALNT